MCIYIVLNIYIYIIIYVYCIYVCDCLYHITSIRIPYRSCMTFPASSAVHPVPSRRSWRGGTEASRQGSRGKPWENHGKTMGKWWFHGIYGVYMVYIWIMYEESMVSTCIICGYGWYTLWLCQHSYWTWRHSDFFRWKVVIFPQLY